MRPMETYETQRDYWRFVRKMETHETQRYYWRLTRLTETNGDQWEVMRFRETNGDFENQRDNWTSMKPMGSLMRLRETTGYS